jgi:hypothetical protein
MFELIFLLNFLVTLANALNHATLFEAKLKTTTKALEEAENKCVEEVDAAKLATDQAVKEAEARAIKAKETLAEVSRKQSKCEEAVVKRIDDLLNSFGSKCHLAIIFVVLLLSICILTVYIFVMQQSNLEKLSEYVKAHPKTFFLTPLAFWNRTGRMSGTCLSEPDTCYHTCLLSVLEEEERHAHL